VAQAAPSVTVIPHPSRSDVLARLDADVHAGRLSAARVGQDYGGTRTMAMLFMLDERAGCPPAVEPGDIVCVPATGAYGVSMASNYNKVPRPAVVFLRGGTPRLVVRRETPADLVRLDLVGD